MGTTPRAATAVRSPAATGSKKHPRLDRNRVLRERYLAVEKELTEAKARKAHHVERRARAELKGLENEVIRLNYGLAGTVAKEFTRNSSANREDYMQAALLGLWEAFLKWDPALGTLGTFSRRYIQGQTRREVRRCEYSSISYNDFTARVGVLDSIKTLTDELGHDPTDEQVAQHCDETVTLVERVRRAQAVSLDTPVNENTTLGDLAASVSDPSDVDDGWDLTGVDLDGLSFEHLKQATSVLSPRELFVYLRRSEGIDPSGGQTLVELANLTGLGREILRRCEVTARGKVEKAAKRHAQTLAEQLRDA